MPAKNLGRTTRRRCPNVQHVELTDADLVARVLVDDDQHAFGELVRRHQSSVRGLLRQLTRGDLALADDLAQDAFVRAYKNIRSFRGEAKFSTWLYRIAYNCFREDARRRKVRFTSRMTALPRAFSNSCPPRDRQVNFCVRSFWWE